MPEQSQVSLLEATDLTVWRGDKKAVNGISLSVARSEILSIVGPSGSGKSSLLCAVAGLIPSSGLIRKPDHVGVVFQDHGVFPWLTVEGNVGFGLRSLPKADREKTIQQVLATCGISEFRERYPAQLSGGQRQRVAVARTLATHTELVLLDEPFSSLDVLTRIGLRIWLRHLVDQLGVSMVLVTHDIDDAITMSDRIMVLVEGKVRLEVRGGAKGAAWPPQSAKQADELRQAVVSAMMETLT